VDTVSGVGHWRAVRSMGRHGADRTRLGVVAEPQGHAGRLRRVERGAAACVAPDYVSALAIVSLALFGHTSWSSNMHTAITEAVPPQYVAMLYGITGAAGTLGGVAMQSAVGRIVDSGAYDGAFALTAVLYSIAIGCVFGAGRLDAGNTMFATKVS